MLILLDQSSTHSLILKLREDTIKGKINNSSKEEWLFEGLPVFDIFDEVDALMTPKKSYIYSIGKSSPLDESLIRCESLQCLL